VEIGGQMIFTKNSTGALKEEEGKAKLGNVPVAVLERIARRLEIGTQKYGKDNWKLGLKNSDCIHAALRHIYAYVEGQHNEDHLGAALTNLSFIAYNEKKFKDNIKICDIGGIKNENGHNSTK
jgi:hypothetical protein